jgi:hypothetical protein
MSLMTEVSQVGNCHVRLPSGWGVLLRGYANTDREHAALHSKDLHGKPSRLRDTILVSVSMISEGRSHTHIESWIARFGAITAGDGVLASLHKQLRLFQMLGKVI